MVPRVYHLYTLSTNAPIEQIDCTGIHQSSIYTWQRSYKISLAIPKHTRMQ